MNEINFIKGTEDNYTHIKFYYSNGSKMRVNKSTYKHVYPNEKKHAKKFEYQIEVKNDE